jgi:hypothetical protein
MFKHKHSGQWAAKIGGRFVYLGSISGDPLGVKASELLRIKQGAADIEESKSNRFRLSWQLDCMFPAWKVTHLFGNGEARHFTCTIYRQIIEKGQSGLFVRLSYSKNRWVVHSRLVGEDEWTNRLIFWRIDDIARHFDINPPWLEAVFDCGLSIAREPPQPARVFDYFADTGSAPLPTKAASATDKITKRHKFAAQLASLHSALTEGLRKNDDDTGGDRDDGRR